MTGCTCGGSGAMDGHAYHCGLRDPLGTRRTRPADENYVGAWGESDGIRGFIVSLEPLKMRDLDGLVIGVERFTRVPTDPNTPREVRAGAHGFLDGKEGRVTAVYDDGTIGFAPPYGESFTGDYRSFRPLYASNH